MSFRRSSSAMSFQSARVGSSEVHGPLFLLALFCLHPPIVWPRPSLFLVVISDLLRPTVWLPLCIPPVCPSGRFGSVSVFCLFVVLLMVIPVIVRLCFSCCCLCVSPSVHYCRLFLAIVRRWSGHGSCSSLRNSGFDRFFSL